MKKSTLALLGIGAACLVAGGWYAVELQSTESIIEQSFSTQSAKKSYYILFQNQNELSAFEGRIATTVSRGVNALTLADEENNLFKKHNLPIVQVNETSRDVAQYLAGKSALVEEILPIELFQTQGTYNDPLVDQQWYIQQLGSVGTCGGEEKILGIHDTGVKQHEDLLVNGVSDNNGHGTAVAGAAGAQTNNAIGIASMSEGVQIISKNAIGSIAALLDLYDQGAQVINMSYGMLGGTQCPQIFQNVINYLSSKGVQFVAAAGNISNMTPTPVAPATCDNVLSVGAIDSNLKKAQFSHEGDIYAPGVNLLTTDINGGYKKLSGTSFSSAIVAGLLAKGVDVMQHLKTNSQGLQYIDLIECTDDNNGSGGSIGDDCLADGECTSGVCEEIIQGKCVSGQYGEKLSCKGFTSEEQCLGFKQDVGIGSGLNSGGLVSVCAWEETVVGGTCVASCGNKIKEGTEQCDDGNAVSGDGCSATCEIENIVDQCADGYKDGLETDIDCGGPTCPKCVKGKICGIGSDCITNYCNYASGNNNYGRCDETGKVYCDVDKDTYFSKTSVPTNITSGYPYVTMQSDGLYQYCTSNTCYINISCQENPGNDCDDNNDKIQELCPPQCGNNVVEAPEQCDDGNNVSGDGCSNICKGEAVGTPEYCVITANPNPAVEGKAVGFTVNGYAPRANNYSFSITDGTMGGGGQTNFSGFPFVFKHTANKGPINLKIKIGNDIQCELTVPVNTPQPTCGNNIIEAPEQCDGSGCAKGQTCAPAGSKNACTCQFEIIKDPTETPPTRGDQVTDR